MAGLPPGIQAGPPQGGLPMGAPGAMPPIQPPGSIPGMPPMGPPPFAPQAAPPPLPIPPQESIYTDISQKLEHRYQILDAAARMITRALDTGGFYTTPDVLAAVVAIRDNLEKIIDKHARRDNPKGKSDDSSSKTMVDSGNVEAVDVGDSEE